MMAGESDLWYRWYPGAWKTSTTVLLMTLEEQWLYREMLDYQALNGGVTNNRETARELFGAKLKRKFGRTWDRVVTEFVEHPEDPRLVVNPILHAILEDREAYLKKQRDNGRKGGRRRSTGLSVGVSTAISGAQASRLGEGRGEEMVGTSVPTTTTRASSPPELALTSEPPKAKRTRPDWVLPLTEHIRGTIGHVAPETVYKNARAAAQQVEDWPPLANGDALSTAEVLCGAVDRYRGDTPARYCSVKAMWGRYAAFVDYWRPGGGLEGLAQ